MEEAQSRQQIDEQGIKQEGQKHFVLIKFILK